MKRLKSKFLIDELSIVVPVYNNEKVLGKCLDGIYNQSYYPPNFEVIVINDGSTDKSKEVALQYPVILINLPKNKGRITARDIGVKKASYDYIIFIDSDCEPGKNWLLNTLMHNYEFVQGQVLNLSVNDIDRFFYLLRKKFYKPILKPTFINTKKIFRIPKGFGNLLCSKKLYNKVGFYRKEEYFSDDQYFLYEVCKYKQLLVIPDSIVHHNERDSYNSLIKQWYQRGNRFADFYFKRGGILEKEYYLIIFFIIITLILWLATYQIKFHHLAYFYFSIYLIIYLFFSFYIIEKPKDLIIAIFLMPPILISFFLGVLNRKLILWRR